MMTFLEIVLALIIVALLWVVWKCYKKNEADKKEILAIAKEKDGYEELGKGLAEYNQKLQDKKEKAKSEILEKMGAEQKISNHDVAEKLGVSRYSVARYFDELEREGKVKQVGKTGRKVIYKKT
jgi:predicted HTH transcriptional regulator